MANKHTSLASLFGDIATAIREKTGQTGTLVADDFPTAIAAINAAGGPFWIECGAINTASSSGHPSVDIVPENLSNYDKLLGCCIWFTNEAGDIDAMADFSAIIYVRNPGTVGIGIPNGAFECSSGTVSVNQTTGCITWTGDTLSLVESGALAHYIVYGFK